MYADLASSSGLTTFLMSEMWYGVGAPMMGTMTVSAAMSTRISFGSSSDG